MGPGFPRIAALTQQDQWQREVTGDRFRQRLSSLCTSGGNYKPTFGKGTSLVVRPREYGKNNHWGIVVSRMLGKGVLQRESGVVRTH